MKYSKLSIPWNHCVLNSWNLYLKNIDPAPSENLYESKLYKSIHCLLDIAKQF